jgi:predicted Ser/Thr protein kinase
MSASRVEAVRRPRIGRYLVTGRIGRGGMGVVYRGYDEALERELAVKTLTVVDEDHRRRFAIEAKAAAKLQHPNIVTVYELGEDRGLPFIAMELLSGWDLESLLRSGDGLLVAEKLEVMAQVCRGLQFAHERGVIHRDMKPSNIRVLEDGTAKILDFGIAKLGTSAVTRSGMMVGTVHYMSPEQIRGATLDGRSDVFSMGVILYELLVGHRPFRGEGVTQILYKIVHEEPEPFVLDPGEAEDALSSLVRRTLAKDPGDRPASAGALGEELGRVHAQLQAAAPAEVLSTLQAGRKLVEAGRSEEGLRRLQEATDRNPRCVEARRVLRWATAEIARRSQPSAREAEEFPELLGTAAVEPTRVVVDTEVAPPAVPPTIQALPTQKRPAPPAPAPPKAAVAPGPARAAWPWLAAAAVGGILVGGWALTRSGEKEAPPPSPVTASAVPSEPVPAAGPPSGVGAGRSPRASTPPAASSSAASTASAGSPLASPAAAPPDVRPVNEPTGRVFVSSPYPVDVVFRGRVLSKSQTAATVDVPLGAQALTIVAADQFLRATLAVDVGAEGTEIRAPPLGKVNIRATPDTCQILINGAFVDYPPILDRSIAAGAHTVSFVWPDGARRDETVQVKPGAPAYVTGRKDAR